MSNTVAKKRPEYRNIHVTQILKYRLPLAGKLSILHRVSGAVLFLALPVILLPLFDKSITSELTFLEMQSLVSSPLVKIVLLGHFAAGIRYLVLDMHVGTEKYAASKSAGIVFAVSLSLTALFGLKLFGVF
jgi:succinate dehydrogenase / fumarate reductase, cytochrome b subunit